MKSSLRQSYILKRKNLTEIEISDKSLKVIQNLLSLEIFQNSKNICIYASSKFEVQTINLIEKYYQEKNIFLPHDNLFISRIYNLNELKMNKLGILQPLEINKSSLDNIDIFIVPGIAFDKTFNRLGYGKGYFDKLLKNIKKPKIGLAFNFQLLDKIPFENHDVKMDYIITEEGVLKNDY